MPGFASTYPEQYPNQNQPAFPSFSYPVQQNIDSSQAVKLQALPPPPPYPATQYQTGQQFGMTQQYGGFSSKFP